MFDWVWELLWQFQRLIFQCIDWIEETWKYLAGSEVISDPQAGGTNGITLLEGFFTSSSLQPVWLFFLVLGLFSLTIAIVVGFIKSHSYNRDSAVTMKRTISKTFTAIIFMISVPIIIYMGIVLVGAVFSGITDVMQSASGGLERSSVAQAFFEFCLPEGTDLSDRDIAFSNATLYHSINIKEFNFFIGLLVGIILVFILGFAAISLVERIINIVLLYLVSPIVIAALPLDEGNRLTIWKDQILAKLLGAGGIILSMYLYQMFIRFISSVFDPALVHNASDKIIYNMVKLISIIGGALVAAKGGLTIAQLIGHNAGVGEGMQQGASRGLLMGGMMLGRMAFSGLGAVMKGTRKGKAAMSSTSGASSGSGGGIAGASGEAAAYNGGRSAADKFALNKGVLGNIKTAYNNVMNKKAGVSNTAERMQLRNEARSAMQTSSGSLDKRAEKRQAYAEKFLNKKAGSDTAAVGGAMAIMTARGNFSRPPRATGAEQAASSVSGSAAPGVGGETTAIGTPAVAEAGVGVNTPSNEAANFSTPVQSALTSTGGESVPVTPAPLTPTPMPGSSDVPASVSATPASGPTPVSAGNRGSVESTPTSSQSGSPVAPSTTNINANAPRTEADFSRQNASESQTGPPAPVSTSTAQITAADGQSSASAATPSLAGNRAPTNQPQRETSPRAGRTDAADRNRGAGMPVSTPPVSANAPSSSANFSTPPATPPAQPAPIQPERTITEHIRDAVRVDALTKPPLRRMPRDGGAVQQRLRRAPYSQAPNQEPGGDDNDDK